MSWLKNMGITKKLAAGFLMTTAITLVIGIRAMHDIGATADNGDRVYAKMTRPMASLGKAAECLAYLHLAYRDLALSTTPEVAEHWAGVLRENREGFEKHIDEVRPSMIYPKAQEAQAGLDRAWKALQPTLDKITDLAVHPQRGSADLMTWVTTAESQLKDVKDAIDTTVNAKLAGASRLNDENTTAYKATRFMLVSSIAVGSIVAAALGIWLSRLISRPLD